MTTCTWLHEVISLLSIPTRFVPSEEPDMVSFDKDGIFVDVSVSPFFSLLCIFKVFEPSRSNFKKIINIPAAQVATT